MLSADHSQAPAPWWKRTTVYHVYPRSFHDSNGDGIGDLPGIIAKLDYLQSLGVETLWLSPFYGSPQADFGYDISDHFSVAPEYGTLADCRRLIDEVHARGMHIVLDMVMNHTSDRHAWFLESRRSRNNPRRDWYIWRDGRGRGGLQPPTNWRSMLGGSGWHHDAVTDQWYWASFLPFQPDLNYRNPEVKHAMLEVVRHWLRQGVDGLRLDIFNAIYKDPSFADNPRSLRPLPSEANPDGFFQRNIHTINHPDTIEFARELRAVIDEFADPPRFLVGEVFGDLPVIRRYCGPRADGLHMVFLFKTMGIAFEAPAFRALIREIEREFPDPLWPTYVFSNHDRPRALHKLEGNRDKAKLLCALQLTVRGVPFIYYGEEIGMVQRATPGPGLDPLAARFWYVPKWLAQRLHRFGVLLNRDECRLPMQWDGGTHAGFAPPGAVPWLPVHPQARAVNVAAQEEDRDSILACYRRLLALRRERSALHGGALHVLDLPGLDQEVLAYRRKGRDETLDVLLNFAPRPVPLPAIVRGARVLFSTRPSAPGEILAPYEGIVVKKEELAHQLPR